MNDQTRNYHYQAFTLVDITNTGVTQQVSKQRNQQRNWETILQLLGLRSQILAYTQCSSKEDPIHYEFGNNYSGSHMIWIVNFTVEFSEIYKVANDPVGQLIMDFNQVPIITGLDETATFPVPLLYTVGEWKNIYFKKIT